LFRIFTSGKAGYLLRCLIAASYVALAVPDYGHAGHMHAFEHIV